MATPAKPRAARVLATSPTTAQFLQTPPTSSQLPAHPVPAVLVSQPLLHLQPPTTPTSAPQPNDTAANPQELPHQPNPHDLLTSPSQPTRSPPSSITRPAKGLRKHNPFRPQLSATVAPVVSSVHPQLQPQPRSHTQSHSHVAKPSEAVIRLAIVLAVALFPPATLTSLWARSLLPRMPTPLTCHYLLTIVWPTIRQSIKSSLLSRLKLVPVISVSLN